MTLPVIALVLAAALLHASWNALLKSSHDRLASLSLMTLGAGLGAIPLVLWRPWPQAESWFYILLSGLLHTGYNLFLIRAYRIGDFGQSYPIARGSSPLLVALGAAVFAGEQLGIYTVIGIALVSLGIVSLANLRAMRRREHLSGPLAALATGAFIAAYTITDGIGARLAGDAIAYAGWLFVADSIPLALLYQYKHGRSPVVLSHKDTWIGLAGGVMSLLAYGIVIWAVTLAPMGMVSALRETSVLFALLIGTLFLGEKLTLRRVLSCAVIAAGAIVLGAHH
ncbi:DMT family transporter [Herbaspirillum huttiense F1]|uniref:DMT family transporter n=1 Tax=Herbaspirillum TaxID=963 RepID=UPI001AEACC39|nr:MULTISPECIES: DMT family transporter [Herbaspirillum]MBP1318029.1 drug/metabolite transporter (DMT)-like permease [Herbaspirillum sp. 1130]MDR6742917.1 drug/metabolite transporter (DMT)-like permease [Herbaspirillum sp. 1173]MDT0358606.1 DMT family transporter [Herbaspirillum huttiense F1]